MLLENPALSLNINVEDILKILEKTLYEKNWKHFDLASLKLVYTPYYLFNYDTLIEQPYSQSFSGLMAINAVNGRLEPDLSQIIEQRPVNYEKEITHDLQYELENPAITGEEVKEASRIKLAGQFNTKKENVSVSGFRLVYWPVWRIFVELPEKIQKIDIDAVIGYALNFEEVPEREKTWLEVTKETFEKLKTPKGWAELSKKTALVTAGGIKKAVVKKEEGRTKGAVHWLLHTRQGIYSLILLIILIIAYFWLSV